MPSPPDLKDLTFFQQILVLIGGGIAGAVVWIFGLLKPKEDQTKAPNIVALENDRLSAEILDKVRTIMEARAESIKHEMDELREKQQSLEISLARLETRLDGRRPGR